MKLAALFFPLFFEGAWRWGALRGVEISRHPLGNIQRGQITGLAAWKWGDAEKKGLRTAAAAGTLWVKRLIKAINSLRGSGPLRGINRWFHFPCFSGLHHDISDADLVVSPTKAKEAKRHPTAPLPPGRVDCSTALFVISYYDLIWGLL